MRYSNLRIFKKINFNISVKNFEYVYFYYYVHKYSTINSIEKGTVLKRKFNFHNVIFAKKEDCDKIEYIMSGDSDEDFDDAMLWETELEIALLTKCDYGSIRNITKLRPIPSSLRSKVWKVDTNFFTNRLLTDKNKIDQIEFKYCFY